MSRSKDIHNMKYIRHRLLSFLTGLVRALCHCFERVIMAVSNATGVLVVDRADPGLLSVPSYSGNADPSDSESVISALQIGFSSIPFSIPA